MGDQINAIQKGAKHSFLIFLIGNIITPIITIAFPFISYDPSQMKLAYIVSNIIVLFSIGILHKILPRSKRVFTYIWGTFIIYNLIRIVALSTVWMDLPIYIHYNGIIYIIETILLIALIISSISLWNKYDKKSLIVLQIAFLISAISSGLFAHSTFNGETYPPMIIYQTKEYALWIIYILGYWKMSKSIHKMAVYNDLEETLQSPKIYKFKVSARRKAIASIASIATFAAFVAFIIIILRN